MYYAIIGTDRKDSLEARMQARPEHIKRLTILQDKGHLLLAGPCPAIDSNDPGPAGFTGSLIVAEFPTLEAAQIWADADPYMRTGVYTSIRVTPFKKVFP